jgi:hypothetical protein
MINKEPMPNVMFDGMVVTFSDTKKILYLDGISTRPGNRVHLSRMV